jgi:error-prone DNA polymerase
MSFYVPFWCKSNFSFLEGASHPDELVDEAYRLGLPALALTDRDGVYGVVRAHVKAREVGMKVIIGSEVSVDDGSTIVLLAQDRGGYANLCRLITKGRLRLDKGRAPSFAMMSAVQCREYLLPKKSVFVRFLAPRPFA